MIMNVDFMYPIGSIYLSVKNVNPSVYFGGTWTSWGTGRVPVGVDTTQSEFNTVEKTGGSKYLQQHKHSNNCIGWSGDGGFWVGSGNYTTLNFNKDTSAGGNVTGTTTGNSGNLQPYITCYMWKRTA